MNALKFTAATAFLTILCGAAMAKVQMSDPMAPKSELLNANYSGQFVVGTSVPGLPPLPGMSAVPMASQIASANSSGPPSLRGIFMPRDGKPSALLDGKLVVLGQKSGIWVLSEVTHTDVLLISSGQSIRIAVFSGSSAAPALVNIEMTKEAVKEKQVYQTQDADVEKTGEKRNTSDKKKKAKKTKVKK